MRPYLILLLLLVVALGAAQPKPDVVLIKASLARDDGKGRPGKALVNIGPKDNPFFCVLELEKLPRETTFAGRLIATDAGNVKNFDVAATDVRAAAGMNRVNFKFSLPRPWPLGAYRIELFAAGKRLRVLTFRVR